MPPPSQSLGTEAVAELLPYLQSAALRTPLRKAVKAAGIEMDDLRAEVAKAVDAEIPDLIKLRRLTWWTVIQVALLVLAAAAVLSRARASVDWSAVRVDLADATLDLDRARVRVRPAAAADAGLPRPSARSPPGSRSAPST